MLAACNQNSSTTDTTEVDTVTDIPDTLKKGKVERKIVSDSLILYDDSLYNNLELNFTEISKNEFESYKRTYKTRCVLDSGNFISGSDLYVGHNCDKICETYLSERATNRKMLIPSNYDSGILSMLLSPECNKLVICSSYDGSDYENYYEERAEIFVFNVTTGIGLKGIKPDLKYYTKDWSIEDLTWVNGKTIVLKIYEENRWGDGSGISYKYLKADLYK